MKQIGFSALGKVATRNLCLSRGDVGLGRR